MIKLTKMVLEYLESIHPNVYFKSAPKKVDPPYIVFDFPNVLDDGESLRVITVDIDGWDTSDTTALEVLMESVNSGLNKRILRDEEIAVSFYLDTILSLDDDDPRIKRWKCIYQARLIGRS